MTDINTLINESIKAAVSDAIGNQLDTNNKLISMIELMQKYVDKCDKRIVALEDRITTLLEVNFKQMVELEKREVCFDSVQFDQAVRNVIRNCL